jgi:hypothetical protein
MNRKAHIYLAHGIILVLTSAVVGQEVQWLQYRSSREASSIVRDMGLQRLELTGEKPTDVNLPQFDGEEPLFAKWPTPMVASGHLWVALERTQKYGSYDRLFIDANDNGRLDDEAPITAYRSDQYNANFGPVKVTFQGEDGPITYHLNLEFYGRADRRQLYVRSAGWYEGDIMLAGQKKHCLLFDYNANGAFNDKSTDFRECDRVRIGDTDRQEARFAGSYIEVDGTLYNLEVARDGAYVKLAKAEGVKFGDVRLPESVTEFVAGGENGLFTRKPENSRCSLPVGKYRIERWTIQRKDDKDAEWKLQGMNFGDEGLFDVTEARAAEISVGEPIVCALQVDQREPGYYFFGQQLKGKLGERLELTRNNARPQPPKVQIKTKDGKYDRTFSFEYG